MKSALLFVAFTLSPLLLLQRTLQIQTKAAAAQTQNLKTLTAESTAKRSELLLQNETHKAVTW